MISPFRRQDGHRQTITTSSIMDRHAPIGCHDNIRHLAEEKLRLIEPNREQLLRVGYDYFLGHCSVHLTGAYCCTAD